MKSPKHTFYYPLLFLLFLVSGFCGLLYQVIWLRLAFAAFGIITPVLSVVISVFMLGLAIGTWAGGRFIENISNRTGLSAVLFYAVAEFLIGIGGIAVPKLFDSAQGMLLSAGDFNSLGYLLFSALTLGISILPWCVCMGATIPLMMAFIKERDITDTKGFSFLYLANVIGAMCGTIITAVFLIELFGLRKTLLIAASCNFFIAIIGLMLSLICGYRSRAPLAEGKEPFDTLVTAIPEKGNRFGFFAPVLFITGFTSMAMEVVWTRAFTPVLKTTIYAFASILAVYLLATWIGSWLYRKHSSLKKVFSMPYIMSGLAFFSLIPLVFSDPRIWRMTTIHYFKISKSIAILASIFPFCAMLGYLMPKLIDEFSQGNPKKAGKIYTVNIIGCILGPLFAGYVLLPVLGIKLSLLLLSTPFAAYLLYYFKTLKLERPKYAPYAAALTAVLFIGGLGPLSSYEESIYYLPAEVRRDYVATVISSGKGMDKRLLINGFGTTSLTPVTKCMAHVPLAIGSRKPESILIICFGMGTTFRSAASWNIDTTAIELVPSVRDAFGYYFEDTDKILAKPNVKIIIDDGRRFLMRTTELFDVITIDPPPPTETSGSSLLYSEEFYRLLKKRLKKGGILAQWFPGGERKILQAVAKSLSEEFPYVRVFNSIEGWGYHFFASMEPFEMPKAEVFESRLPAAGAADLVEWNKTALPSEIYAQLLEREIPLREIITPEVRFSVTDDRPFNEYFLLRRIKDSLGSRGK